MKILQQNESSLSAGFRTTPSLSDKRFNVLHVAESFATGVLQYLITVCGELDRLGVKNTIIFSRRPETPENFKELFPISVEFIELKPASRGHVGFAIDLYFKLKKEVEKGGHDIVHLHSSKAGFLGRLILQLLRYRGKTVYCPHGLSFLNPATPIKNILFRSLEYIAGYMGDTVALACSRSEEVLLRRFHAPVIHLDNPLTVPVPNINRGDVFPLRILGVGRLCAQKVPGKFSKLVSEIRTRHPMVEAIWIGDGEESYKEELLSSGVIVTGWLNRDELCKELEKGGVYVSTSAWEGLPLSTLEAMAFQLPSVVTDCVGNRDVIAHGQTGYICSSDEQLLSYALKLLGDPARALAMGRFAAEVARKKYDSSRYAIELLSKYVNICSGNVNAFNLIPGVPRVLQVVESFGAGVLNSTRMTCKCLVDAGLEVIVIHSIRDDTPPNVYTLFDERVRFIDIPMRGKKGIESLRAVFFLSGLFRQYAPEVVHLQSSIAGGVGRLAMLLSKQKSKFFYSPRGFSFLSNKNIIVRKLLFFTEWALARLGGRIVACSKAELDYARIFDSTACLIENARPNLSSFKDWSLVTDKVVIGSMGRAVSQKRPELFAKLCALVNEKHNCEFVWIGSGDSYFESVLKESGVNITGWIPADDAPDYIKKLDIYVQTSLYEGLPLSVIEAQIAGVPCVVTDVVGNRDVIEHGETGFVGGDIDSLLQYVELLVDDVALRAAMGAEARKRALSRFSVQRFQTQLLECYGLRMENSRYES